MRLREFINIFPEDLEDCIESISYSDSDVDFELEISVLSKDVRVYAKVSLFSDCSGGVTDIKAYDEDGLLDNPYLTKEFINVVDRILTIWDMYISSHNLFRGENPFREECINE